MNFSENMKVSVMRYKMMGGIEQGIHYTTFQEDIEDENQQNVKEQEGVSKSDDSDSLYKQVDE